MTPWIRSPAWDGFWILSGLPFGVALTALSLDLPPAAIVLGLVFVFQTGHLLSPMALAWSHAGFRPLMLRQRMRFVAVPLAILVAATLIGVIGSRAMPGLYFDPATFAMHTGEAQTWAQFSNPLVAMVALYGAWNAYHFGKQAFGVLSIYRRKIARERDEGVLRSVMPTHDRAYQPPQVKGLASGWPFPSLSRRVDLWYACAVVWLAMAMPFAPKIAEGIHNLTGLLSPAALAYVEPACEAAALTLIPAMLLREFACGGSWPRAIFILTDGLALVAIWWWGLWGLAILALNHWLVAIGLASHAYANRAGCPPHFFSVGLIASGTALFCLLFVDFGKLSDGVSVAALHLTASAVGFRLGLGFVHFLYDRWVWRLGDPRVAETVGRDLMRGKEAMPNSEPGRVLRPDKASAPVNAGADPVAALEG